MRRRQKSSSSTPAPLHRLGIAAPLPFVGRTRDLDALAASVEKAPLTVVTGAAGVGKTALAREYLRTLTNAAMVRCEEDDLCESVLARAERALDVVPGTLPQVLASSRRVLILDELHRLQPGEAARLIDGLVPGAEIAGRIVAMSRDVLPLRRGSAGRADVKLDGLIDADGRALWSRLEETYGPTSQSACDTALERTRGVPLAMRREYARAAVDKKTWDIPSLSNDERRVLCAAAVLRLPATPAALGVLCPHAPVESCVRELMRRQLVDALGDGRLEVHDVVRAAAVATLSAGERKNLELGAASLLDDRYGRPGPAKPGREDAPSAHRCDAGSAWEQVDGAALDVHDPVDRLREAVRHLVAAGKQDAAAERLAAGEELLARRGGGGEALALIALVEAAGGQLRTDGGGQALRALRARVLARLGRVAEALEQFEALERLAEGQVRSGIADGAKGAQAVDPRVRIAAAELAFAAGDLPAAISRLDLLANHIQPEVRARAIATLAEIEVEQGKLEAARRRVQGALDGDRGKMKQGVRVRLRLLAAQIDERDGRTAAARQALGRVATQAALAAGGPGGPSEAAGEAGIAALRAGCLMEEGRFAEADQALAGAERAAREQDEPALGDEIRRRRAQVAARTGRLHDAETALRELAAARRGRGAELGALRAELELAEVLTLRGRALEGGKIAAAVETAAQQRGLATIAAEARVCRAAGDLDELSVTEALALARQVAADPAVPERARAEAERIATRACAWLGEPPPKRTVVVTDDLAEAMAAADVALARGDAVLALAKLTDVAARAERADRRPEMVRALTEAARLHRARGDRPAAECAAARALGEGASSGLDRAVARALLVRAGLSRDEGDLTSARSSAADALTVARAAGLAIERFTAAAAAEVIAREVSDAASAETLGIIRRSAAATLSEYGRAAGERMLADLGLSLACPYRLVSAEGTASYVAEVDAATLRLDKRSLVIDGAGERILRGGKVVADLRRRSLLKRLLFLFAGEPAKLFTKEEIVKRVWDVDYHPLRHDAALFTNVMRLRRLLGTGGQEILRVGEGGYRLEPPKDFLFVDKLSH